VIVAREQPGINDIDLGESGSNFKGDYGNYDLVPNSASCRIALLSPYSGNNLGDAAILDAAITNLRARVPDVHFSGITLNCENFVGRHGDRAFRLCAMDRPFYGMSGEHKAESADDFERSNGNDRKPRLTIVNRVRELLKGVVPLWLRLRVIRVSVSRVSKEIRHWADGYRFLRAHDLLIVSGGGQLDEEWGGPWGLPYTILKWAILARINRVPFVIASVGVGIVTSRTSRLFLSIALRCAQYRSYRDKHTKKVASELFSRVASDPVVPDLAFSIPASDFPQPSGVRRLARGRTLIALSPIAFAKPGSWPSENEELYRRYLQQMAHLISQLLERGNFLVMVWSALSDRQVIREILSHLDAESRTKLDSQMHIPAINSWRDLVAVLLDADFLIASRLHSVILGSVARCPTVAISFDPKVDWAMADLGQTDYLFQIRNFAAEDVIRALDHLLVNKRSVVERLEKYRITAQQSCGTRYESLASLVNSTISQA
jgi:polysaccharide pyruvyl transferase WcaK-like protein